MKIRVSVLRGIFSTGLLVAQVAEATPCAFIRRDITPPIRVVDNYVGDEDKEDKREKGVQKKKTEEVTFAVNMHCDNCKAKIERALTWHKGVKDLEVKLKALTVRVRFDTRKTSIQDIQQAITALGYTCELIP
jgi:copper chaperone CopZ